MVMKLNFVNINFIDIVDRFEHWTVVESRRRWIRRIRYQTKLRIRNLKKISTILLKPTSRRRETKWLRQASQRSSHSG